jgi:hypothetical protein
VSAQGITLSEDQLRTLAVLIVDEQEARQGRLLPTDKDTVLIDAASLARRLGCDTKTVYRHADELQAIRVGRRVMFDPQKALSAWSGELGSRYGSMGSQTPQTRTAAGQTAARRKVSSDSHCQLLPVGRRQRATSGAREAR